MTRDERLRLYRKYDLLILSLQSPPSSGMAVRIFIFCINTFLPLPLHLSVRRGGGVSKKD